MHDACERVLVSTLSFFDSAATEWCYAPLPDFVLLRIPSHTDIAANTTTLLDLRTSPSAIFGRPRRFKEV